MYSDDKLHEECGVFGIFAPESELARLAFFALYALQHRGQEAAGIVTCDGHVAHVHKGMGLVSQVFNEENLAHLRGHLGIGHTRYSTTGSVTLRNTQPYIIETLTGPLAICHNGNLVNGPQLRRELLERGVGLHTSTDSEVIIHLLAGAGGADWMTRIRILMAKAVGAFTLCIMTNDAVYGVRDPWGLRPLVLGQLESGGYVLASESCAFATIGASMIREILPGEIVRLDESGYEIVQGAPPQEKAFCTFEQIYFARPDSLLNGTLVHQSRQALGRQLAREAPVDADIVVPVPDSGTPHAIGYAQESGIPYSEGLIKSRYIGRTFIQPTDALRKVGVSMKFNPLPDNLAGQRVVMVDDSIVRGNTSGPLVKLLREAGAKEVHVRVACPSIKYPCFMGVDMAGQDELIAAQKSLGEIRDHIGADSLAYISIDGMMQALAEKTHSGPAQENQPDPEQPMARPKHMVNGAPVTKNGNHAAERTTTRTATRTEIAATLFATGKMTDTVTQALADPKGCAGGYCNACFTGKYPFDVPLTTNPLQTKDDAPEMWGD